jgi:tRNA pseudouridine38-40 synthase
MHYFKLNIAYDGTDFYGWQIQSNKPTIQGEIVSVLRRITQESVFLHGAGRTDAGVHALGQVGSFCTQSSLSAGEFQRALNALLPHAIRVVGAEEVGPNFHARWSSLAKTYRYRLYRGKVVPPALWRYVLHYPFPLDEDAMRVAASRYVGPHDFASFAASTGSEDDDKERSTVREIYASELANSADGE